MSKGEKENGTKQPTISCGKCGKKIKRSEKHRNNGICDECAKGKLV